MTNFDNLLLPVKMLLQEQNTSSVQLIVKLIFYSKVNRGNSNQHMPGSQLFDNI